MKEMATYMLEVLVCSGVLLGLYAILLDRQVRFRWCRIYLLAAMAAAVLIPALQIPVWPGEVVVATPAIYAESLEWGVEPVIEPGLSITWEVICAAIYLSGAGLILGLMIWQTICIRRLRRNARITRTEHFSLIRTPQKIASFSFFRSIFIWHKTPDEDFPAIIAHESSHIAHRHSVERIVMGCLKAIMWWNPFVWIASRRLTEVEEYEADNDVVKNGYDIQNYMQILLKQLFGYTPQIANGLQDSLTKKRFKMMTSNTNDKHGLLRLAGTLPAVIALLCIFGFTTRAAVIQTPEAAPATTNSGEVQTTTVVATESQQTLPSENTKTCKVRMQVYAVQSEGDVFKHNPIQGATVVIVNKDAGTTTNEKGCATIIAPRGNTLKVSYLGYKPVYVQVDDAEEMVCDVKLTTYEGNITIRGIQSNGSISGNKQPLYIVDEKEVLSIKTLTPDQIDQITVLKDKSSVAKYGERAANGVIFITTKQGKVAADEKNQMTQIDESEPFITTEVMPIFQGGNLNTFREWVQSQIQYPAEMLKKGVQGRVTLSFVIERDGSVSNLEILQTPDRLLSEQAKRVVLSSPKWTPGKQLGKAVRIRYTLPVDFKIKGNTQEKLEPYNTTEKNMPKFQDGGITEFRRWVQMNVRYPSEALKEGLAGRVVVAFTVGKDGSVKPGKVLQTPGKVLSEEVLRVLKKSPDWTPGTEKGKATIVKYVIPIEFKLSGSEGSQQKKVEGNIPEIIVVGYGTQKK